MKGIKLNFRPEIEVYNQFEHRSVACPSCQVEVGERDIIEKRGSLGCVRCLKI